MFRPDSFEFEGALDLSKSKSPSCFSATLFFLFPEAQIKSRYNLFFA